MADSRISRRTFAGAVVFHRGTKEKEISGYVLALACFLAFAFRLNGHVLEERFCSFGSLVLLRRRIRYAQHV